MIYQFIITKNATQPDRLGDIMLNEINLILFHVKSSFAALDDLSLSEGIYA